MHRRNAAPAAGGTAAGRPLTPDAVTHAWYTVAFGQNFAEAPRLITSLATFDGIGSAHLRYDRSRLTAEGVAIRVEEVRV